MRYYQIAMIWVVLSFSNFTLRAQNMMDIDSLKIQMQKQVDDTVKVKTINHIINYYMYRDIDQAKNFAHKQLKLAEKLDFLSGKALANYQLAVVNDNLEELDSAGFYYHVSLEQARQLNNPIYLSKAYHGLAIMEFHQGNLDKADSLGSLNLEHCLAHQDTMGAALAYDFRGTIFQNRGYYAIALTYVLEALKLLKPLGDSIRIADAMNHLATLELNFGNFKNSIEYNSRALTIYRAYDDHYFQAQALNDIGVSYKSLGENEKALDYFYQSIEKAKTAKVTSLHAASLNNIGAIYTSLNQPGKAIESLNESIKLSTSINAKRRIAIAQNSLAETYLLLKQPGKALAITDEVIAYATTSGNNSIQRIALKHRSEAFEMLGQSNNSLQSFKKFKSLSDTILNKEKVQKIEELRILHDTEQKEAALALQKEEINTLNEKTKVERLNKSIFAGGMGTFVMVSGLLFFGFRQRMKKNRIEQEKQIALYEKEIEYKKKELASQTLHLVQKNVFIQELKENLENLKDSPEKFKMEFRRIATLLKKENASDKNWETFKSYFVDVHKNFDDKLRQYGDITENEIRLAAFLRMNLTTKEIAAILNVMPDSIFKSKYRLKKKLGLAKETDLGDFLNTL